jgi:hypothetical protein
MRAAKSVVRRSARRARGVACVDLFSLAWTDAIKRCAEDGGVDNTSIAFLAALTDAGISYDRTVEIY